MLNSLSKFGYRQIPTWAHPQHPVMRTILGSNRGGGLRRRLLQFALVLVFIGVAIVTGYIVANEQTTNENPTINEILYWPLLVGQMLAMLGAIALTSNAVSVERQKQTWDSLKLSLNGVGLALRARWASAFYRLWWLLFSITVGRIIYIAVLLDDMTEFQGRALDLRISGITPEVSLDVTIIIMALNMTAFIVQPFVAVALAGAIGLLLSVFTKTRGVVILGLLLLIGLRLVISISGIVIGNDIFDDVGLGVTPELAEVANDNATEAWARMLFSSLEGDQMLKLMHLDTLGQIWADVDYGIYIGAAMLGLVLLQAIVANVFVIFAAWRAARPTAS